MHILADENVPEEYVSALRGDGQNVVYSRAIESLGPEADDGSIAAHAAEEGYAVLSTDVKDFGDLDLPVPVFVAPQDMSGGAVRTALARVRELPFDPSETEPIWLSSV